MWTISNFPAFKNLSGCTIKCYYACPVNGLDKKSHWLTHSKKCVFLGNLRFLPNDYSFRSLKKVFNNKAEWDEPPKTLFGQEILKLVDCINYKSGKHKGSKQKCDDCDDDIDKLFKRKSIFFYLEYWQHLLVRYVLDVMHIEKNVCESIYGTLLHQPGKTKDRVKARRDLIELHIRGKLISSENDKNSIPVVPYTLSKKKKKMFCQTLFETKVPEGYSSNFKSLVNLDDCRLQGLKSHDCHTLMQQLLPLAVCGYLPENVRKAINRMYFYFNTLCSKVLEIKSLDKLEKQHYVTMCLFEQFFQPSLFDIMVHLTVHLVDQVRLYGPVHLCWMYPFERNMKLLKGYVRNHCRPEGCIAEYYVADEALEFCTEYLFNHDFIGLPPSCLVDYTIEKPLRGGEAMVVDVLLLQQAHLYVLENTIECEIYNK